MEREVSTPISYTSLLALMVNPDGVINFVTQPMAQILGYKVAELIGQNVLNCLIADKEKSNVSKLILAEQSQIISLNTSLISKQNEPIDLRLQLISLKNNLLNEHKTVFVSDNIIFGSIIKKALDKRKNELFELFDLTEELIVILNSRKEIVYTNPSWDSKLGQGCNKKGIRNFENCFEKQSALSLYNSLEKLNSQNRFTNIELSIKSKSNGKVYHLRGYAIAEEKNRQEYLYQCIFNDITEDVRAEKVKNLYYNVSSQIVENADLPAIYKNIHKELMEAIDCPNLYIALYNPGANENTIQFPYYIDDGGIDRGVIERPLSNGITEYAIKNGTPLSIDRDEFQRLDSIGKITIIGKIPEYWMGVPLTISGRVIGVLAVQSYSPEIKYTQKDLELLDFASSQIALAIEMARTREELQSQTARLNSIFESSSLLIWSVNKDLEVTSFNKNYFEANFINYDADSNKSRGKSDKTYSLDRFWQDKYKKAFKGEKLQFEIKLKDESGKDIWKEIYLNPIYTGINKIEEVSGIAHDVTQKKRSELALLKSEEKFRNIFESFQDLYFRCNLHGKLLMVSPSVLELTGYRSKEVIGKHIDDYYLYNPRVKRIIKELRTKKNLKNVEVSIVKQNGEVRQCICNIRMVQTNKSEPFEIEGVVRDITQLKLTNQQLIEANETTENSLRIKEQFLANMSHEIRTPMNGIIGMIDLLEQSVLDKKQKNYVGTLKKSSSILMEILNDILDISKIEAGRMELKPHTFFPVQLVNKIKALFSPIAATNHISLSYYIDKSVPEQIIGDETRLIQVLSNLISNALKFTESGGSIDISLDLLRKIDKKIYIRVEVTDSGIGISREDQKRLFSSFTQLDNSTTKPYSGTGLGLSISKQLVNLMGGKIGVYSNLGKGSTFWFTFEALISDKETVLENTISLLKETETPVHSLSQNVLVVDDNLINREVAGEILSQSGCNVKLAQSGLEAIELVEENDFDIVFMDIQMPEMDGIQTTRRIKKLNKRPLPKIIAMTAYAMKEDEEKFIKKGLDDYLAKPIRAQELIDKVVKWSGTIIEKNGSANGKKANNTPKVINKDVLEQLEKYGGKELIDSVYDEFEVETMEQLEACKKALTNSNWIDIQKLLHTIKGTSGTLGIEKISEKAKQIEFRLKKNDNKGIEKDFSELIDNFVEFQDNFRGIIRNN
ncbi:MAG: PAS domain S-box protein [Cyclobacteriaceae bacterium]|nr:PAS domain S-box protein [Cyclobacteriaceae bacterium]